jgi:undecaprenyl diphosphate synthase
MPKKIDEHEHELKNLIAGRPLPRHIAIIMDGNGRWAKMRSLPRVEGHRAGINSVRASVEGCAEIGIEYLTLYAFSTENWKRPKREVSTLMKLLKAYIDKELNNIIEKNIRFSTIGRTDELHEDVKKKLYYAMDKSKHCTGLHFVVALNYSGRTEIVDAFKKVLSEAKISYPDISSVDEDFVSRHLYTADIPDPDLLIRTSGEYRISNFLLWQIAYAEIYITDVLWPDFSKKHLYQAILDFQKRERRYGGITE